MLKQETAMADSRNHLNVLEEPLLAEEVGTVSTTNDDDDGDRSDNGADDDAPRARKRASRPTVKDCLGVPEKEFANIELDVYNMLFISDLWSQPFFYSIAVLITKMGLYIILIIDLLIHPESYPFDFKEPGVDVKLIVKLAQFFLIPVAIVIQEELMISFFVFGNLQYSPGILQRHPGAYKWKWYSAHLARALDGVMFLFINTFLMLKAVNMLAIFLNFAALMFLQAIDNVALKVCQDGYWTRSLQECAEDVVELKFAFKQKFTFGCLKGRTTILWVAATYAIMVGFWVKVHFIDT